MAKPVHVLVLGQSNVANHGKPKGSSDFGRAYHDGSFHPLVDPLPGGTGKEGTVWTRVAPLLRDRLQLSDFVVSLLAQGGTSVGDWSTGGKCFEAMRAAIPKIAECPVPVTHVLYHQGERDTLLETDTASYVAQFSKLHEEVQKTFQVPWIVCRVSYRMGVTSADVIAAQDEIIRSTPGCIAGPNTDQFGSDYRYDDTHFNEKGVNAFAAELAETIAAVVGAQPGNA
ncbi:MAG: hypothetical protein K0U74_02175 [Alphaproteobacteria bacterium]|nr:hypothetical protein [Alphaproteobacteria bacterium]